MTVVLGILFDRTLGRREAFEAVLGDSYFDLRFGS